MIFLIVSGRCTIHDNLHDQRPREPGLAQVRAPAHSLPSQRDQVLQAKGSQEGLSGKGEGKAESKEFVKDEEEKETKCQNQLLSLGSKKKREAWMGKSG